MQSMCPDGQRDEFGFLQYSNSTVTQLLERINEVVEESNLFDPDRPGLDDELESLRKHLDSLGSDPYSMGNVDSPKGLTLDSVVKDKSGFQQFLMQNLSLPSETAALLLESNINMKEVYHLFLRSATSSTDEDLQREPWGRFGARDIFHLQEHLLGGWKHLEKGLIRNALNDPKTSSHRKALMHPLSQTLGLASPAGSADSYDPEAFVTEIESILFTPSLLEALTCDGNRDELRRILIMPESQYSRLSAYHSFICNGSLDSRKEYFKELAKELKNELDVQKTVRRLSTSSHIISKRPTMDPTILFVGLFLVMLGSCPYWF